MLSSEVSCRRHCFEQSLTTSSVGAVEYGPFGVRFNVRPPPRLQLAAADSASNPQIIAPGPIEGTEGVRSLPLSCCTRKVADLLSLQVARLLPKDLVAQISRVIPMQRALSSLCRPSRPR